MTIIQSYYDLLNKITLSDFNISLYANTEDKGGLDKEQENNSKLKNELDGFIMQLSEKSDEVDRIGTAFLHVANGIIDSFDRIKSHGNYYTDLGQGMVIPGYLFGKILEDFKIALQYDCGFTSIEIYMSKQEWRYEQLYDLIQKIRNDLFNNNFTTKMEAIEYYEYIKKSVLELVDTLRQQKII